ncbi:bifunctional DNA-formamidopyrimidine glycosylase/DNA-(apurinic or apyrimidinic site) lyase [Acetobacter fallax]|uniref:Formamidopyrimidine-DNA glycosylase n=1 Tax=Acetobacter fallax TaxID=1737473 RepID=A0ABX0K723_9PROT|nr:bifunctional DNA-formamidopyrimidine glycosylase/DNA-(apurinic or apyrimidinic site) lyase [Acetobacter fallax]NHO31715.1 bifunctional DNA-formamidopyrimidine glycosylase/DNA-(apurinic or apyrimidinic site) lyase [Acetobacter fallax]NHO35274.1 bifunctional DNA-formamidopyrimidine glycosylase/DNA-(apurinic or apyrimidinic site) lyase [Acetobacter fallax]
MPELPEVETVMRGMRASLEGHRIISAVVRRPDLRWPLPKDLTKILNGRRIESFRRRGKYIFMRLSGGMSMLLHLGMSGRVTLDASGEVTLHEHVTFTTEEGRCFGLIDPRRFGAIDLVPTKEEDSHRFVSGMGPEPLDPAFTAATLAQSLAGRRAPIKAMLLDQRIVAGLGNIYVCEALFRARIHPATPAGILTMPAIRRLVRAIRAVLTEAIAAGGSSLRDYVQPDGELGYFQHAWRVYGRAGQPCPECPTKGQGADGTDACPGIVRITQSGRSTFFCPRLQTDPAAS